MTFFFKNSETKWFLFGTLIMVLSLIYFSFIFHQKFNQKDVKNIEDKLENSKTKQKNEYILSLIVISFASLSYISMLFASIFASHNEVTIIRYFEWMITTPILLIHLSFLAMLEKQDIYTIILLDVFMIGLGFAAVYSRNELVKYFFFTLSLFCMIGLFYILFSNSTQDEENKKQNSISKIANIYTIILWSFYPIIWFLGYHGKKIISISHETLAYMILDILAKAMFAYIFLEFTTFFDTP